MKENVVSCVKHSATEETLQSIDDTLKRIEKLLRKESNVKITAEETAGYLVDSLENAMTRI